MTIRWRLKDVMAANDVKGIDLAEKIGIHPVNLSRLRSRRDIQRIDTDVLNKLCRSLNCKPGDLIEYIPDDTENNDKTRRRFFGDRARH